MRRVVLIGVASVIALVASLAVAGPIPKGGTFAGIAGGGGGAGGLSGTIADNQVVCGTGASSVDSNAALTCTGGALGATTVTGTGLVQGSDLAASDLAAGSTASVDVASENAAAWTYCQGSGVAGTVISGVNRANTCEVGFEGGAQTVIWTADAQPMYFATNATLAMTIEADQDVVAHTGLSIANPSATVLQPDDNFALQVSCDYNGACGINVSNENAGTSAAAYIFLGDATNSGYIIANDSADPSFPDRFEVRSASPSSGINIAASGVGADIRFLASAGNPFDTSDEKARINADGTTCWGATSCTETMSITGTLSSTGNATFNGNVTLGSDTADAVTLNADLITVGSDTVVDLTSPGASGLTFSGGQVVMTGGVSTSAQPLIVYNSVASSIATILFANNSGVGQGNIGYANSGYTDADFADRLFINSASQVIMVGRNDNPAAGTTVFLVADNLSGSGVGLLTVDGTGNIALNASATRSKGTITLAAGTGTATVASGAVCTCTDTTAANAVQCAVASTTLTATGTGTDVIAYHCI